MKDCTELDEVFVTPRKSVRRTRDLNAWLKRLEGQYRYEGYVDLCGQGHAADRRPVTGEADCVSLYETFVRSNVGLYCALNVRWPQVQGENVVDVEIESRRVLRHAFLLHRVSNVQLTRTPNGARMRAELLSVGEP